MELKRSRKPFAALALAVLALLCFPSQARPYSVLTHEAIIDTLWNATIRPLLLARFPEATPDDLLKAHAQAYGGCIIQDMGYYPFGSKFFSDLVHYVRSGDFVVSLIRNSQDLDEYAFALGAMAHYAADNAGHPMAINISVPLLYPKLRREFGRKVTYSDDPLSHIRTEFAFDVLEIAHNHYAPESYHDFIGFQVSKDLMKRAFQDTYSIDLSQIFSNLDLSLGTYRWSVNSVIPTMTKVAWHANRDEILKEVPSMTRTKFLYRLKRASYEKEWGHDYQRLGIRARLLAFLIRILPKIGPLRKLKIPIPTPEAQKLFMASFNATLTNVQTLYVEQSKGALTLPNENFDVGRPTVAGGYKLADDTYAKLLGMLAAKQYSGLTPELRSNILNYYQDLNRPISTKKKPKEWASLVAELTELKALNLEVTPSQ